MGTNTINGNANTGIEVDSGAGGLTINAPLTLANSQWWINNSSNPLTVNGPIGGPGGLTTSGSGTIDLTNSNTYSGVTQLNNGTLLIGNPLALQNSTVNFNGGELYYNGFSPTLGGLMGSTVLDLDGFNLIVGNDNANTVFAGTVANYSEVGIPSNFTKVGLGALTLTGAIQPLLGIMSVAAGTLQIGTGGTVQMAITDNAVLAFSHSDTLSYGWAVSGSGSLTQMGPGTLIMTGSNSYTGGTTISAGVIQAGNSLALGASTAALAVNGGTLDLHGYGLNVGQLNGAGTVNNLLSTSSGSLIVGNGNTSSTFSGTIQNTAGTINLIKMGSGTLTFSTLNSYTGTTLVSGGTLLLANTAALSGSTFNTSGSGSLSFGTLTAATFGGLQGSGSLMLNSGGRGRVAERGRQQQHHVLQRS